MSRSNESDLDQRGRTLRDAILISIGKRPFSTFQDLTADVPEIAGDRGMFPPTQPAVIIWHALSQSAIAALGSLIAQRRIYMHLAPTVSYRADLDFPKVAVCRNLETDGAGPEIKWLPVVFSLTPQKPFDPFRSPVRP